MIDYEKPKVLGIYDLMIEYKKVLTALQRIANWIPSKTEDEDPERHRLNLEHIQRYAAETLNPPADRNELVTLFQEFCRQRKTTAHDPTHDDYVLCVQPDGSGRVAGPSVSQHIYFRSLDHGVEVLQANIQNFSLLKSFEPGKTKSTPNKRWH